MSGGYEGEERLRVDEESGVGYIDGYESVESGEREWKKERRLCSGRRKMA